MNSKTMVVVTSISFLPCWLDRPDGEVKMRVSVRLKIFGALKRGVMSGV